jgi:2-iminoacetate synthase ThiH
VHRAGLRTNCSMLHGHIETLEEHIYHDAGARTPQEVAREELALWIEDAGRIPVERDTLYRVVWSADETLAPVGAAAPVNAGR